MVCSEVAVFPQSSVAVHVRTKEPVFPQPSDVGPSLWEIVTLPHVSLPVAEPVTDGSIEPETHSTCVSGTSVIVGLVVSTMFMVCSEVFVSPQAFVAVQVRTNEPVFPQPSDIGPSECEIVTSPQVSLPVAEPVAAGSVEPVHSTVASGTSVIVGGVVSTIVIVCSDVFIRPHEFVAFHVRTNEPVLPQPSDIGPSVWLIVTLPQESLPVAEPVPDGSVEPLHSTVASGTSEIVGGVVSTIVIVCTHEDVLEQPSVAVQVRVITPVPPQPGANESVNPTVGVLQLSVAVADPVAAGRVLAPHSRFTLGGHEITGAVVSTTLTVLLQVIVVPVVHPPQVTVSVIVYEPLHTAPAITLTDAPLLGPSIVPFPVIDQL